MKRRKIPTNTMLKGRAAYEADYLEQMIEKRMTGEDLILGGKGLMYTERADGVLAATNIRTDKFNEAMMAMDGIEARRIARGEEYAKKAELKTASDKGDAPSLN